MNMDKALNIFILHLYALYIMVFSRDTALSLSLPLSPANFAFLSIFVKDDERRSMENL